MKSRLHPMLELTANTARLSLEAGEVIGLRLLQAAFGVAAHDEAQLMITEKAQAALDAQFLIAGSVMAGEAHLAPGRAVALYRRRVQANRRRLTRLTPQT
jgi:hypothetical protein